MAQRTDREPTTDLEQWRQVDLIFQLTVERSPEGRQAFLEAACGNDTDLRRRVESLLRLDAEEVPLLDRPAAFVERQRLAVRAGEIVGSYRIGALLGEGGTSVVYEADRVDGRIERRVAVKLLKHALFSPEAHRRFLTEGRILARLEHPNIAQIYDAGTTDTARYRTARRGSNARCSTPSPRAGTRAGHRGSEPVSRPALGAWAAPPDRTWRSRRGRRRV